MPRSPSFSGASETVHRGAKSFCLYVALCPGIVALIELTLVCCVLLVSLLSQSMKVEANFASFTTTDIESSILLETWGDAAKVVASKSTRRLSSAAVVKDVVLAYELQDAEVQDGLFNLKAQRAISKLEQSMRGLKEWQDLCSFSSTDDRTLCNPGVSFTNYILPTQAFAPGTVVPNELLLNGEGISLLPLWAALWLIGKYALKSAMLPVDLVTTPLPTKASVLRSFFRFRLQTVQHSASALRDRWHEFVSDVLLPFLERNSDGGIIKVYYDGTDFEELEVLHTLKSDVLLTVGSLVFVLLYMIFHTQSVLLSLAGLFTTVLSVPCAFVVCSWLSDSTRISFASFLAVFMIIGFGADVIFVYTDLWSDSLQHCSDDDTRLWWTLQHAGRASFITTAVTSLSFLANLASLIRALRQLGLFMGLCVLFAWLLITTIYLPLCLFDERRCGACRNHLRFFCKPDLRKRSFQFWAFHVYRWRWCYVILSLLLSCSMLVIAMVNLSVDSAKPRLFPDSHNRNAGDAVWKRFEISKNVFRTNFQPPVARIGVCSDVSDRDTAQACEMYWCDAYHVADVGNNQHACFRREHPCGSAAANSTLIRFVSLQTLSDEDLTILDKVILKHISSTAWSFSLVVANPIIVGINPRALLLQDWEGGRGLSGKIREYTVDLKNHGSKTCGWNDVCFQAGHACQLASSWQPIPHLDVIQLSTPAPRLLVSESNRAKVRITFGLKVDTELFMLGHEDFSSRWSFDPLFKLSHPWSQRYLYNFCTQFSSDLKVTKSWCWVKRFKVYLASKGLRFPALEFDRLASQFMNELPLYYAYVWMQGGKIKAFYVSTEVDEHKDVTDTGKVLDFKRKWDEYVNNYNSDAFLFAQGAFHTSELWVDAETPSELIASNAYTLITLFVLAFAGMLIFTCSLRLSLYVVLATLQVVCGLLFFVIVLMDWNLGVIETVALIYFMGYALTYSLHIAHKYGSSHVLDADLDTSLQAFDEAQHIRFRRTLMALQSMGSATIGSATTTAGSAFFLLLCTFTVFMKLGCMCFIVAIMSIIVALLPLPALLMLSGPTREKGDGSSRLRCRERCLRVLLCARRDGTGRFNCCGSCGRQRSARDSGTMACKSPLDKSEPVGTVSTAPTAAHTDTELDPVTYEDEKTVSMEECKKDTDIGKVSYSPTCPVVVGAPRELTSDIASATTSEQRFFHL